MQKNSDSIQIHYLKFKIVTMKGVRLLLNFDLKIFFLGNFNPHHLLRNYIMLKGLHGTEFSIPCKARLEKVKISA